MLPSGSGARMTIPSSTAALDRRGFLASALALPLATPRAARARGLSGGLSLAQVLEEALALASLHVADPGTGATAEAGDEAWVFGVTALLAGAGAGAGAGAVGTSRRTDNPGDLGAGACARRT